MTFNDDYIVPLLTPMTLFMMTLTDRNIWKVRNIWSGIPKTNRKPNKWWVLEEIALEGASIATGRLWERMSIRLKLPLPLKENLIDAVCNYMKNLNYYLKLEAREPLKIHDRPIAMTQKQDH